MTMSSVNNDDENLQARNSTVENVDETADILVRKGCIHRAVNVFQLSSCNLQ